MDKDDIQKLNDVSSAIIREVVLPEIEKEVNTGENFTSLRQVYNSMILATWFKRNLKESFLSKVYVGENKIAGVDVEDKGIKEKIYQQYLEAFKKGVYNYIKEDYDPTTQEMIPRKYFSGGMEFRAEAVDKALLVEPRSQQETVAEVSRTTDGRLQTVSAVLDPVKNLNRLLEILRGIAGDEANTLSPSAQEDEILEFIVAYLKSRESAPGNFVREETDQDGNRIYRMNDHLKTTEIGKLIRDEVMNVRGGVKAVNFKGTDGIWKIIGFEGEIDQQLDLEREEVKERKQGKHWIVAFNEARKKVRGEDGSIDLQSAQEQYEVARNDVMSASIADWFKRKKKPEEIVSPVADPETVADEVKVAEQAMPPEIETPTAAAVQTPAAEAVQTPPAPMAVEEQITVKTSDFDAFGVFMSDQPVGELSKPPTLETPADEVSASAPVSQPVPTSKYSDPELNRLREKALSPTVSASEKSQVVYSLISMAPRSTEAVDILAELIFSGDVNEDQKISYQQPDLRSRPYTLVDTLLFLLNQGNESVLPYLMEIVQSDNQQIITNGIKERVLGYLGNNSQSPAVYQTLEQVIPNLKGMMGGSLQPTVLGIMTNLMFRGSIGAFESLREIGLAVNTNGQVREQIVNNLIRHATSTQSEPAIKTLAELTFSRDVDEYQKVGQQQLDLRSRQYTLVDTLLYLLNQGNESVLPYLVEVVQSDDQQVITSGIKERVLGYLGNNYQTPAIQQTLEQLIPNLKNMLGGSLQSTALNIMTTLMFRGSIGAFESLREIALASNTNGQVREQVVNNLIRHATSTQNEVAIKTLSELTFSRDIDEYQKIGQQQLDLRGRQYALVDALLYLLNQGNESVLPYLAEIVQSDDQQVITNGIKERVLGYLGNNYQSPVIYQALEQVIPSLKGMLGGSLQSTALNIMTTLMFRGSEGAFNNLKEIALASNTDSHVREQIIGNLMRHATSTQSEAAIQTLSELTFSRDVDEYQKVGQQQLDLRGRQYALVDTLLYLLNHGNESVLQSDDQQVITNGIKQRVLEYLGNNFYQSPVIHQALEQIVPQLKEMMGGGLQSVALNILTSLMGRGSDVAFEGLLGIGLASSTDARVREQVVNSLVRQAMSMQSEPAIKALVDLTFSNDVEAYQRDNQQPLDLRNRPYSLVDTLLYLFNQGNQSVLPHLMQIVQSDNRVITEGIKERITGYLRGRGIDVDQVASIPSTSQPLPSTQRPVVSQPQPVPAPVSPQTQQPVTTTPQDELTALLTVARNKTASSNDRDEAARKIRDLAYQKKDSETITALAELIFSDLIDDQRKFDPTAQTSSYEKPIKLVDALIYLLNLKGRDVLGTSVAEETFSHLVRIVQSEKFMANQQTQGEVKLRVLNYLTQSANDPRALRALEQLIPEFQGIIIGISKTRNNALVQPSLGALVLLAKSGNETAFATLKVIALDKRTNPSERDAVAMSVRDLAYEKKDSVTISTVVELIFSDLTDDNRKFDPTAGASQGRPYKLIDALVYLAQLKGKEALPAPLREEVLNSLVRLVQTEKFMANQSTQVQATVSVIKFLTGNASDSQVRAALEQLVPEFQNIVLGTRKTRDSPLINDSLEALGILARADSEPAFAALKTIALDKRTGPSERESVAMKLRDLAYEKRSAATIDTVAEMIFSDLIDDQRKFDPQSRPSSPSEKPYKLIDALVYLLLQGSQEARPHLVKVVQAKNVKGITDDAKKRVMENLAANGEKPGIAESLVDIISSKNVPADIQKMGVPGLTRAMQSKPDALDNVLFFVIQDNYYLYFGGDIAPDTFSTEVFSKYRLLEQESILTIRRLLVKGNIRAVQEGLAQGKFTQEKVIYAMLLNKLNNIVSQTADQVMDVLEAEKKKGSRNNKGIMDGMVSLASKLSGTPYTEKVTLTGIKSALAAYGIADVEETLLRRLGFRTLKNGMVIPLAFDVLLSTYRGSATFDSLDATYLTHAITTAIIKYANKGGEFAKGSGAFGANAVHEFDQGGLNLLGENGRTPDTNVSLAFSYPSDKPMPDYTRKRTMRLDANTVAGHLLQLMQWQLNERKAKQNIMKVLQLIATGKINPEKLPLAIEFVKKQIEILYDEKAVGLNKHHVEFLVGYLNDSFYEKLVSQYKVGTNNRPMLNQLLVNAMKGYKVVRKLGRAGGSDQLVEHPWVSQKIQFSRSHSEPITLLNYLGNEEYIRRDTFDDVDLSDRKALEDFVKGAETAVAVPATAAPQAATIKLGEAKTSDNTVYLFFAGRVSEGKGAEEYLNVLSETQKKYQAQGIKVAGRVLGAVTASYRAKLQNLARNKGIENLEFFGEYSPESFVSIMNHYPQKNCIFVHTLGLVTREVMSMGIPVVTRDSTVKQGIYQVPVSGYSQAISDLIDHPEKREQLVTVSRQAAEAGFGSQIWLNNMLDAVERVTGKKMTDSFRAYFTFSGFGYGKHGVNEYYNKFFRYLAKRLGLRSEVDVVSMQQRYFMGQTFPGEMYVDGVFGNGNLHEFNTYQHIGQRKAGRDPETAVIRDQFIPALKDLISAIRAVKYDQKNIFAVDENSHALAEKAVSALTRLQAYFGQGYDVSKTMLHPSVEQVLKSAFSGETAGLQAHIVSYDKKGEAPTDHFAKLITLMYMLNEKMPEGKEVSFTVQLFPPVLNILHKLRGGPPVIYIEHTEFGYNEKAIIDGIDQQRYPAAAKQFMKQYIALLKMIMVHYTDGYVNPWNGNKLTERYGDFFRGQGILVPHGVDTDLYVSKEGAVKTEAPMVAAQSSSDFVNMRNSLTLPTAERAERINLTTTIRNAISGTGRNRVLIQGSTGRETDLPGRFDVDIITLFDRPISGEGDSTGIISAVSRDLGNKGYRVGDVKQKPHNGSQWLISFVIYDSSGKSVTKVEITLANQREAYPDMFNSQMRQIEDSFGSTGREAVLADIRLMKNFLQNVVESYRWYHGGLSGIGAEQLVIQSGGVSNNGRSVQGLGSFGKAMEWLYRQGYDGQSKTIRSLNEVKSNLKIHNVDGKSFLDNLNEWSWRRLVHAARTYVEGKQSQKVFVHLDDLRYQLTDAMQYRRDANVGAALDFRGDINTALARFSSRGFGADYERVGESRYYVFVKNGTSTVRRGDVEDILNQSGADNILVMDQAQLSAASSAMDRAVLASPERVTENPGGIDLNPNMLELQTQGAGIDFDIPINPQIIETIQIDGFSPVIFQIIPTNLPLLIGTKANQPEQQLSSIQ